MHQFKGNVKIVLGSTKRDQPEKVDAAKIYKQGVKFWNHPQFNFKTGENDISVVKLPEAVQLSAAIQPIKPSTKKNIEQKAEKVILSGFGVINTVDSPVYLQTAEFTLMKLEDCKKYQNSFVDKPITAKNICAIGEITATKIVTARLRLEFFLCKKLNEN